MIQMNNEKEKDRSGDYWIMEYNFEQRGTTMLMLNKEQHNKTLGQNVVGGG